MSRKGIPLTAWETLLCVWETFTGIQDRKAARFVILGYVDYPGVAPHGQG